MRRRRRRRSSRRKEREWDGARIARIEEGTRMRKLWDSTLLESFLTTMEQGQNLENVEMDQKPKKKEMGNQVFTDLPESLFDMPPKLL